MSDNLVRRLRMDVEPSEGDMEDAADLIEAQAARIEELEGKMRQILEWHPTITTAPRRRISEIREIAKSALTGGKKDE